MACGLVNDLAVILWTCRTWRALGLAVLALAVSATVVYLATPFGDALGGEKLQRHGGLDLALAWFVFAMFITATPRFVLRLVLGQERFNMEVVKPHCAIAVSGRNGVLSGVAPSGAALLSTTPAAISGGALADHASLLASGEDLR
jgi:hypothetical protein